MNGRSRSEFLIQFQCPAHTLSLSNRIGSKHTVYILAARPINNLINKFAPTMGTCFKAPIYNHPGDYPVAPITQTFPGAAMSTYQPGVAVTTTTTGGPGPFPSGVAPYGALPRY